jgi:hypothetical protein
VLIILRVKYMRFSTFSLIIAYPCHYSPHIIIFPHLLSINHKCSQPCPSAAQKLKKIWSTLMRSSRQAITTGRLPVELWCLSATMFPRVFNIVFCKTLFDNNYYILWHWLFCIFCTVCVNLIPGHTYYEHLVWP